MARRKATESVPVPELGPAAALAPAVTKPATVDVAQAVAPLTPVNNIDGWSGHWLLADSTGSLVTENGIVLHFARQEHADARAARIAE